MADLRFKMVRPSVRPSVNIKLFSVGGRIYQNIKQKENQRGPLGDHLKDDPASGDKF